MKKRKVFLLLASCLLITGSFAQPPEKDIALTLTIPETNQIIGKLSEGTFKETAGLIYKINSQAEEQLKADSAKTKSTVVLRVTRYEANAILLAFSAPLIFKINSQADQQLRPKVDKKEIDTSKTKPKPN